jgi:hypothetical protein
MREKRTFNGGESALLPGRRAHEYGTPGHRSDNLMHFTDSNIALRDAVVRVSKRLSSWEFIDGAERVAQDFQTQKCLLHIRLQAG